MRGSYLSVESVRRVLSTYVKFECNKYRFAKIIFQQRCVFSHMPRRRTQWIDRLEDCLIMCCLSGKLRKADCTFDDVRLSCGFNGADASTIVLSLEVRES